MRFYTRSNKSKSDIQAANDNSRSIELQAISSINNSAVELTKAHYFLLYLSNHEKEHPLLTNQVQLKLS